MRSAILLLMTLTACDHSGPFTAPPMVPLGPASTVSPVPLTFNPGADYWPTWTDDGQGILYQYSQPGSVTDSRCIGMLPAAGGTQLWTLCDSRLGEADSTSGFAAFALSADGRLIYLQSVSRPGDQGTPNNTVLWLADTAHPFTRTALATLPAVVGSRTIGWLADAAWTGPTTWVALGEDFTTVQRCDGCFASDTAFTNGVVVAGSTATPAAGLHAIAGTNGAIDFSVAEGGASIVFATGTDNTVQRVRLADNSIDTVGTIARGYAISGVSCRGTMCVATTSAGTVTTSGQLWLINLSGGGAQLVAAGVPAWYTGHLAPTTGDVVVQAGGAAGYQRLNGNASSNLLLLPNVVH